MGFLVEFPKQWNREFFQRNREFNPWNRELSIIIVSVRALHACSRPSGCDLLSTADSVEEEDDYAKNDGQEALGTGIVLAGIAQSTRSRADHGLS